MAKFLPTKRSLRLRRERFAGLYSADRRHRARRLKRANRDYIQQHETTEHPVSHKKVRTIACPARMNLDAQYDETMNTIRDIHKWASSKGSAMYIDFKPITHISPAAALMMAAELDRWNALHPRKKMAAVDVDSWHPEVRRLLYDMGFFSLLRIADSDLQWDPNVPDGVKLTEKFLTFQAGRGAGGVPARKLRDRIETFAGRVKRRMALYDGLVEAMTNVGQHAYGHSAPVKTWWISASIDKENRELTVLCLDHGRGIPSTLPRTHKEAFRLILDVLGAGLLNDDARMINAAIDLERSSTEQPHRGHGLRRDIQRYVESHYSSARLTIRSNHGVYVFERTRDGAESRRMDNMPMSQNGTLIEWVIHDYAEQSDEND